jgi:holo-[acyl-carrier protein] synthase
MPYYKLSERLKKIAEEIIGTDRYNLFLSLSDDKDYASAFTIIEVKT